MVAVIIVFGCISALNLVLHIVEATVSLHMRGRFINELKLSLGWNNRLGVAETI